MSSESRTTLFARLLPALFLSLGASCALPDLQPFADATAELDLAVSQTHDLVVDDLRSLADAVELQVPSAKAQAGFLRAASDSFSVEWKKRMSAMDALLAYSDSLANIADAGKKGGQNSRALAQSVNKMLVSIPSVTAQIPAAVIDLTDWIGAEVGKVRAQRSLAESVEAADGVIVRISGIIAADFGVVANNLPGNLILADALLQKQYGELLKYRQKLIERRAAVSARIEALTVSAAINTTDEEEADLVARLIREADQWYLPYVERLEESKRKNRLTTQIVTQAQTSILIWARSHGEIAVALEDGRVPPTGTLINKAKELQVLVEKLGKDEQ